MKKSIKKILFCILLISSILIFYNIISLALSVSKTDITDVDKAEIVLNNIDWNNPTKVEVSDLLRIL